KFANEYKDTLIPLKLRKVQLFDNLELPHPNTEIIDLKTGKLEEAIAKYLDCGPIVVRFAGNNDTPGMPSCSIDSRAEFNQGLTRINEILAKKNTYTHIIIQNSTPKEEWINKISGRIMLDSGDESGNEEIYELFKGAGSTGILNTANVSDKNFLRLVKEPGRFLARSNSSANNSGISAAEVSDIVSQVESFKEQLQQLKKIVMASPEYKRNDVVVEFSYRDGSLVFTDVD
ncbi:MAG: hypothetical protein V1920_05270, partial [Bacillota bacterium]